jgi:succinate dehydrogenase/fumarate reductase flavoprotein subunit
MVDSIYGGYRMNKRVVNLEGIDFDVYSLNTMVVGTGAAGFNAADTLYSLGHQDIAVITEGINMGTSRNTGSDKQTYYKLTLAGDEPDSIMDMAKTLFSGGAMHGDIALVEAALSGQCFYKLVNIGVPFPHNRFGEYIGYKTDHDPRQRATSCGPLTSKFMTEKLEAQVKKKGIKIFDGYLVIGILTDKRERSIGLVALDMDNLDGPNMGITLFNCTNIIYATGGPAGMYLKSVYPESQIGASGIAYEAGARGVNLTESQYGIASIKFRWNLSGTYQQVIPRYVSTDAAGGDEREFLEDYFHEPGKMLDAIFLKGYQWPFDPGKVEGYGSSLIDILVYNETQIKGRRVFLDFTRNPSWGSKDGELDFSLLGEESYEYLKNSHALFGTPIERLAKMNQPAIDLYKSNGIDINREYLEIDVCAQHNNGGLLGDIWYQSNLKHFFPVGEVNGTFGIYRPGGSALNSTQVGGFRAAQYIAVNYKDAPMSVESFLDIASGQIGEKVRLARTFRANIGESSNVLDRRGEMQRRMTRAGALIRSLDECIKGIDECEREWKRLVEDTKLSSIDELPDAFRNRDILLTQYVYLNAIKAYIEEGGRSRGSYLIRDDEGRLPIEGLPDEFKFTLDKGELTDKVGEVELKIEGDNIYCNIEWRPVRPIPSEDNWFENVWNEYLKGDIIK